MKKFQLFIIIAIIAMINTNNIYVISKLFDKYKNYIKQFIYE